MSEQRFPLSWPQGRKRAAWRNTSPFGSHSMAAGTYELYRQIKLMGGTQIILSTNIELRQDGFPRSDRRAPVDPGVAVYFRLKDKPIVMACDKWSDVESNLWAVCKHIEAIRGTARWGCGELAQAFGGYAQLAAPADLRPWYEVLGVRETCTLAEARNAWLLRAKELHPDVAGGSSSAMATVNGAWARAQEVLQ